MRLAPDARLDDGVLDVVMCRAALAPASSSRRCCRGSSRARTSSARRRVPARRRGPDRRRPAVHRLRRRRPDRRAARQRSAPSPARSGSCCPHDAAGRQGRRRARRGRAVAARRPRRHVAAGQAAAAAGAGRGRRRWRRGCSNGSRGHLGDQRQDDDRRDGRLDPRARRARAGAQPRGREHGGRDRRDAAGGRRAARVDRRRHRPLRDRRVLAGPPGAADPAARAAAGQPLPRPARPLRRAGHDRRPLGRRGGGGRGHHAWCSTPTTRSSPTSAASAPASCTSASRTRRWRWTGMAHAADSKHCRRCGAPYRYDSIFLGHLGHYHCDACGATRPAPSVAAERVVLDGLRGARVTLRLPAATVEVALPLPGLYNVYNALGAAALTTALGASPEDIVAGLEAVAPAFGRAETVRLGGRDLLLLLVKNPAGANEVLRTLALEPGEHDLLAVLNDQIADGRDVSWVWDADFEVLAGRLRRVVCSGTRAAEMAVRLKYAGVPEDAAGRRARAAARRWTARWPTGPGGWSRSRPTPRCSSCAASWSRAASRGARSDDADARTVIWHDVECGVLRRGPGAVARRSPTRPTGRCSTSAPGPGRVALDLAARGVDVVALDLEPELLAALTGAPAAPGLAVATVAADARDFDLGDAASRLIVVPMQTIQLLGGAPARARVPARRPRAPAPRRPRRRRAGRRAGELRRRDRRPARARRRRGRRHHATRRCRWRSSTRATTPRSTACASVAPAAPRGARRHPPRPRRRRRRWPRRPRPRPGRGARGASRRPTSTSARRW